MPRFSDFDPDTVPGAGDYIAGYKQGENIRFPASLFSVAYEGDMPSIRAYGGDPSAADNVEAFMAADAAGIPTYLPNGNFATASYLPTGLYFGPGKVVVAGEVIPVAATPSRVDTISVSGIRLLSFALGQNAGAAMSPNARGNTLIGPFSGSGGLTNGRNSALGSDTLTKGVSVTYMECFGSRAGKYTVYGNRCGFFMSNAGAWAGDPTPKVNLHDFWNEGSTANRDVLWPPTPGVPGTGWRSLIEDGAGEPLAACLPTSHEDNEGNVATGRDAYDHGVKGRGSAIYGHHAAEGWNIYYCSVFGTNALELGLTNQYICSFGHGNFSSKMTGNRDVSFGANGFRKTVHSHSLSGMGYAHGYSLTGGSLDPATALANANRSEFFGYKAGLYVTTATRSTLIGAFVAPTLNDARDIVSVGYAGLSSVLSDDELEEGGTPGAGVVSAPRFTGIGYRNGYQNANGLTNTICVGALSGGLTQSNTGKIGASLTAVTISGAVYASTTPAALANAAGQTLTVSQMLGGLLTRSGAAAVSDTTATAAALVAAIPSPEVGTTFRLRIINNNSGTLTIVAASGVTLAGNTTIAASSMREYEGRVTNVGTPAVTLTGIFTAAA